jgi:hypothetical protein
MNALALNFHNRFSALGSTHGKQHAILPALRRHLGASILLTQTLDTDRFGALRGWANMRGAVVQPASASRT